MKNKVIEAILKAESQADDLQQKGKQESLKIVTEAENKSQKIKQEAQDYAKATLKQKTYEAEEEAKNNYNATIKEYELQADRIEQEAVKNYDKAVALILSKI